MTTDTATDQATTSAPPDLEALHAEWLRATDVRVRLQEHEAAAAAHEEGIVAELDALYLADPMRGDTAERVAALTGVRAELEDVRRRLPAAHQAERRAQDAHQAEQRRAQATQRQERAQRLVEDVTANDAGVREAVAELNKILAARRALINARDQLRREGETLGERFALPSVEQLQTQLPRW